MRILANDGLRCRRRDQVATCRPRSSAWIKSSKASLAAKALHDFDAIIVRSATKVRAEDTDRQYPV